MTHVLMKIKFAPKIDIPGFLEIMRINVTITLPELYLIAFTFNSDFPIKFYL